MQTSLHSSYCLDEDRESGKGVEIDLDGGNKFTIRRAGGSNIEYLNYLRENLVENQDALNDEEKSQKIVHEAYAKTIVVGWNITDADGKKIDYTPEMCFELFQEMPELFNEVQLKAMQRNLFLKQDEEKASKN